MMDYPKRSKYAVFFRLRDGSQCCIQTNTARRAERLAVAIALADPAILVDYRVVCPDESTLEFNASEWDLVCVENK